VSRNDLRMVGVPLDQPAGGFGDARRAFCSEAHAGLVIDEGVAGQDMLPAALACATAESVLLAVATAKCLSIEQTDIGNGIAP
jgi:hypothetical protein